MMDKNWRPDGWKNKYCKKARPNNVYATIYEAGADKMLKACRENWLDFVPDGYHLLSDKNHKMLCGGLEIPKVE